MSRTLVFAVACALLPAALHAQEPIVTDRPDYVESSDVVGRNALQVETSAATDWTAVAGGTARTVATPTLFRLGVTRALELRLETDGYQRATLGAAPAVTGLADAAVGIKWHLVDGARSRPSVAILIHSDLPSGSSPFRGVGVRPSFRVVGEWDLPAGFSMGVMPGIVYEPNRGDPAWNALFGVTVGHPITAATRFYVEYAAETIPLTLGGEKSSTLDLGTAWVITKDIQIDLSGSFGLVPGTPDGALALGVSRRFR